MIWMVIYKDIDLAIAFQHELDHLEGILFTDYIDPENPFKDSDKYREI